jgi:hypothetical protein
MTSTSVSYSQDASGPMVRINVEGSATGFGVVLGTLTLRADTPGGQTGRASWMGEAFLENGELAQGMGEGFFEKAGKHKWRTRSIMRVSNGTVYKTEGLLSLEGRTYKGTLTELD